ncbi:MAG: HD domain-containing protein [Dechloromonas sp.]|nr:HD domain-containing protein [Dechloromonas sp.]
MDALVFKAREFARHAHASQPRRYTGEPYFVHLEEVAGIVERAGMSNKAIAAAWLHDTVEDQGVTPQMIARLFGDEVALMVIDLTDTPLKPGFNREKRKAMDRDRLAVASPDAQSIKCADLISNTSTIVQHDPDFARVYLKEKRAVLNVLTRAHLDLLRMARASLQQAEADLNRKEKA